MLPDQVGGDVLGCGPGLELGERGSQGGGQAGLSWLGRNASNALLGYFLGERRRHIEEHSKMKDQHILRVQGCSFKLRTESP